MKWMHPSRTHHVWVSRQNSFAASIPVLCLDTHNKTKHLGLKSPFQWQPHHVWVSRQNSFAAIPVVYLDTQNKTKHLGLKLPFQWFAYIKLFHWMEIEIMVKIAFPMMCIHWIVSLNGNRNYGPALCSTHTTQKTLKYVTFTKIMPHQALMNLLAKFPFPWKDSEYSTLHKQK